MLSKSGLWMDSSRGLWMELDCGSRTVLQIEREWGLRRVVPLADVLKGLEWEQQIAPKRADSEAVKAPKTERR